MSDDRLIVIAILFCVGDGDGCCVKFVGERFGGGVVGGSVWRQGLASRGTILAGNIDKNGGEENGGFSRICRRHGRLR